MKSKKLDLLLSITLVVLAAFAILAFVHSKPSPIDSCTAEDWEINNCVPAGKCGPTPEIDAHIDCDVKKYDRKFRLDACTSRDRQNDNCVPAGECQPSGVTHAIYDCFDNVKDYDSKFDPSL